MFAAFCIGAGLTGKSNFQQHTDTRWLQLRARKAEVQAVQSFKFLRSLEIEPILIKGWAAARLYPAEHPRFYDDVDLAVSAEDFERARIALRSAEGEKLGVDLHQELRHLDTKPWRSILADSETVELDGYDIRIPAAEDHLRILAAHWLNDGGERPDRLWDIYYAVANRKPDFNWDKCLNDAGQNHRSWVLVAIGLANRYLDLPIDDLPFAEQAKDLPRWIIDTVEYEWKSGVRLQPLYMCLGKPSELVRQIRKRLPPNPIQSTIYMEGDLRNGWRLPYQIGSIGKRMFPSIRGLSKILTRRS